MTKSEIQEDVDEIRGRCDSIEENIKPKKVKTRGDPLVEMY